MWDRLKVLYKELKTSRKTKKAKIMSKTILKV